MLYRSTHIGAMQMITSRRFGVTEDMVRNLIYVFRQQSSTDNIAEVETVGFVKCDFARVHDQDLRAGHMHGNPKHWSQTNIGPLRCHLEPSPNMLEVKVLCGQICVGENRIKIPTK